MNIGELFVEIGAIGNSKELKAFGNAVKKAGKAIDNYDKKLKKGQNNGDKLTKGLGGMVKGLAGVAAALTTAYIALDRLTDSLAKQNLQWLNLTRQSDIALDTFQKWGTIGKIVGVDNAAQQLENLNQKIFNLRLTGEGAKGFQMAGIMPTNAEDVLEQLRTRISGMNNTAASYLLQQMGLDPKMITLLRMGREEWDELQKVQAKFLLNKEQRENIDKMNRQLEVARIKLQYLKDGIIITLMPAVVKIAQAIAYTASKLALFLHWVNKGQTLGAKFTKILLGIAAVIGVINLALWALNAHPIIATITLVLGAIMALWKAIELIADDINHYINGGGSVIGVIAKGLEDLNLKGFIDFPVPKWLEYLIRVVDFFSGNATNRAVEARIEEEIKNLDPDAVKLPNGNYVEIPPEFLETAATTNINNNTNRTANNTTNQDIKVYTTANTLKDITSLPYLRQQVILP